MSKPTPNDDQQTKHMPPDDEGQIQRGSKPERDLIRWRLAKIWRSNGHSTWTAASMEHAIDRVIEKRGARDAETANSSHAGSSEGQNSPVANRPACRPAESQSHRNQILALISNDGQDGLIVDEIAFRTGIAADKVASIVVQLLTDGQLKRTGVRRWAKSGRLSPVVTCSSREDA